MVFNASKKLMRSSMALITVCLMVHGYAGQQRGMVVRPPRLYHNGVEADGDTAVVLYAPGLGGNQSNIPAHLMRKSCYSLLFPEASEDEPDQVNLHKASCGQQPDIDAFTAAFRDLLSLVTPDRKVILCGHSRGAATIVNSLPALSEQEVQRIEQVILSAPFDSLKSVVRELCKKREISTKVADFLHYWIVPLFLRQYNPHGITPIDSVSHIKNMTSLPITIIASQDDAVVPFNCTQNLFKKFRDCGCVRATLIPLETGGHNVIFKLDDRCVATALCGKNFVPLPTPIAIV